jgi:hypothetical protein
MKIQKEENSKRRKSKKKKIQKEENPKRRKFKKKKIQKRTKFKRRKFKEICLCCSLWVYLYNIYF